MNEVVIKERSKGTDAIAKITYFTKTTKCFYPGF